MKRALDKKHIKSLTTVGSICDLSLKPKITELNTGFNFLKLCRPHTTRVHGPTHGPCTRVMCTELKSGSLQKFWLAKLKWLDCSSALLQPWLTLCARHVSAHRKLRPALQRYSRFQCIIVCVECRLTLSGLDHSSHSQCAQRLDLLINSPSCIYVAK